MKKTLLLAFILVYCSGVNATTYYFSSINGNDSNDGRSPSTAWSSFQRLSDFCNGLYGSIADGDVVSLQTGSSWKGSLILSSKNTFKINSYNGTPFSLAKPILHNLTNVTSWTRVGTSNIWHANLVASSRPNMIVIDNKPRSVGRWPNADSAYGGWRPYRYGGTGHISDETLDFSTKRPADLAYAELAVHTNNTNIDNVQVTNIIGAGSRDSIRYSGGALAASGSLDVYGYFFMNALSTLDKKYEWYFDNTNDELYVYYGNTAPASVRVANSGNVINISGRSNVVIDGIAVMGSDGDLLTLTGTGTNNRILNCDLSWAGQNGLKTNGGQDYVSVLNCTINWCMNNGYNSGDYSVARFNSIKNCGIYPGMGSNNNGNYVGAQVRGDYAVFAKNYVDSIGSSGISCNRSGMRVDSNEVANHCIHFQDAAGIYYSHTFEITNYPDRASISYNYVHDGSDNGKFGGDAWNDASKRAKIHGIYLDSYSSNINLIGNAVVNEPLSCIFFHENRDLTIKNNFLFNDLYCFNFQEQGSMRFDSLIMKNNLAVNLPATTGSFAFPIYFSSTVRSTPIDMVVNTSDIDYNKYYKLTDPNSAILMRVEADNGKHSVPFLTYKQSFNNIDAHSVLGKITLPDTTSKWYKILFNASPNPVTYNLDNKTWISQSGVPAQDGMSFTSNTVKLQPYNWGFYIWTPNVGLSDTSVKLEPLADAFICNGSSATNNYGTDTSLLVKGTNVSGVARSTYIKFSLNSLGSNIASAKLRVYGENTESTTPINISCFKVDDDSWTERGINYNNAPSASGVALSSASVNDIEKYYEFDVTDYIKSQYSGDSVASFILTNPDVQDKKVRFNSKENTSNHPQLIIVNSITTGPLDDAFVRNGSYSNTNYGTNSTLEVKGTSTTDFGRLSYLKFPIRDAGFVKSAKLRIYGSNTDDVSAVNLDVFGVDDDSWNEGTITRNNVPTSSTTPITSQSITNVQKYYEFDVTDFVKTQLDIDQIVSFKLQNTANDNKLLVFNSMQALQNKPELVIDFTGSDITAASGRSLNNNAVNIPPISRISPVKIQVYPNPVHKTFKVSFPANVDGNYNMQLIDIAGRIYELGKYQIKPGGSNIDINVPGNVIRSGVYFLKAYGNKGRTLTTKFVLE